MDELESHSIFKYQAEWTKSTRNYLYRKVKLFHADRTCEIGSGSSIIFDEIKPRTRGKVTAVEKNPAFLKLIKDPEDLIIANGIDLPFKDNTFDITLCHYLLIWVDNPVELLEEMIRVTKVKGNLLFLAEPDYTAAFEYPELGVKDTLLEYFTNLGVQHLNMGRKLSHLFDKLHLLHETGVINYSFKRQDYSLLEKSGINKKALKNLSTFVQPIFYSVVHL